MKTIILTGGHVAPAVSIAEEFKARGWRVVVVGRAHAFREAPDKASLEKHMFEEIGVEFHSLAVARFPKSLREVAAYLPSFIKSCAVIRTLFQQIKPDRVLTFGGYLSAPVAVVSFISGIPLFIHDQTIRAGRANQALAVVARHIFISWKETRDDFPFFVRHKIVLTGNPVRRQLLSPPAHHTHTDDMRLYITGGSTGSHAINNVIGDHLGDLLTHFSIIHQCGDSQYNDFENLYKKASLLPAVLRKKYQLQKYVTLHDLPDIFAKSHIVVGRSGANTVIEVALHRRPAVFIPLPYSQYNEQEALAMKMEKAGTAVVIPQDKLTADTLLSALATIKNNYHDFTVRAEALYQSPEITRHTTAHRVVADFIERGRDSNRNKAAV